MQYALESDSPYYATPPNMMVEADASRGGSQAGRRPPQSSQGGDRNKEVVLEDLAPDSRVDEPNTMVLSFFPRAAGSYPCRVLAVGAGTVAMDLRVFDIEATVTTPPVETRLEFRAPIRQEIAQMLPVVNNGTVAWTLSAQVQGSQAFTGPQQFKVEPFESGGTAEYPLKFKPTTVGVTEAKLLLRNSQTGFTFEYDLTGYGDEPLAEDNIVLRCNARESMERTLEVKIPGAQRPIKARVESDLVFVNGEEVVTVQPGRATPYVMTVRPQMSGNFLGSITFTDPDSGAFCWYTLDITVDSPLQEQTIELAATVRQVMSVEIRLSNPLPEPIEFDVVITGDGLLGDENFVLEGGADDGVYELFYSPLIAQDHEGAVAFRNDKVGEFWYKLDLHADPAPPQQLEPLSCQVGSTVQRPVSVENPLGKDITLTAVVSNRQNFAVEPPSVTVGPYSTATVMIEYTPSSLNEEERSTVALTNPMLGDWQYEVVGRGELPGVMTEHTPLATVGDATSYMLGFRNPFPQTISVTIVMASEEDAATQSSSPAQEPAESAEGGSSPFGQPPSQRDGATFALLMRKTVGVALAPFASLQVPLSFAPSTIAEKRATVEIRTNYRSRSLSWVFPVRGMVNAPPHPKAFRFSCKAKASVRQVLSLPLRLLADLKSSGESFGYELIVPPSMERLVGNCLAVNPVETTITDPQQPVRFQVSFEPLKPFSTSVRLVVIRETGGRWPFELQLDSKEPDPDDHITIEAALQTTSSVVFRLSNREDAFANFQAYFTADSAFTMSVSPATGVLPPAGTGGTPFNVSFSPTEYGALQRGRLVIQTDEMQWTYEVTGAYPQVALPQNVTSKVDNKPVVVHSPGTTRARKGSVIQANIRSLQSMSSRGGGK